jgi:hypothetical protein
MKLREKILFCLLLTALSACVAAKKPRTYSNGNTSITLSEDGLNLEKLIVAGMKNHFSGNASSSMWKLYLFDEKTKKINTYPLYGKGYYWQNPWKMGNASISSRDAKLIGKHWDKSKKLLTLNYSHPKAKVNLFFKIKPASVIWWGNFTNKSNLPIYQFAVIDNWRLSYNQQNTFILPTSNTSGIEYKTIKKTTFCMVNAWDGFLITSPRKILSLYIVQPEHRPFLGTQTKLHSNGSPIGKLTVSSDTLCFRKKGQSLQSVKLKLTSFKNLRTWADNYIQDNFPSIKKLNEKIPESIRSKLASAYIMPTKNNMKDLSRIMTQIPGSAILHIPGYMRPISQSPSIYAPFPNYFPPNPEFGSMEDYRQLVAIARSNGHLFMPRNSFFYWVKGSDVDKKYDLKNLAKKRIDGKPRTARWELPGYLISPSSPIVLDLLHDYFGTWKKMGAEINFTNVIGAIGPYGNRYDFHPNAPAPDLYYNQIRKMMKWHGDRMPLLSEGGGAWQLPFQAGFCDHYSGNPAHSKSSYLAKASRGKFMRFHHEIGPMLGHEYVKFYPHNMNTCANLDSIPKITFYLLYGINPKFGLGKIEHLNDKNHLWMKTVATLAKTVFAPVYGTRLKHFERRSDGTLRAVYGDCTIIGNYTGKNYTIDTLYPGTQIASDGFVLYSSDKSTVAGYFSKFAGHLFKNPQLVIIKRKAKKIKLYLPLAKQNVFIPIPLKNPQSYKAVLLGKSTSVLQTAYGHDCLLINLPTIPGGLQKNIPYISISRGKAPDNNLSPLSLQARWQGSNSSQKNYLNKNNAKTKVLIRLENYASAPRRMVIQINGDLWGKSFSKNMTINVPACGNVEKTVGLSGKREKNTVNIKVACVSCKPLQIACNLHLTKSYIPALIPLKEAQAIAPIILQWNAINNKKPPAGFKFTSVNSKPTPEGWKLSGPESRITIGSQALRLNKTIFLECVFRLDKQPVFKNTRGEVNLLHPLGKTGPRTIELRYNSYYDAMRFLIVNKKVQFIDLTCFKQPMSEGKWYHVVAWMDGKKQVLIVNGNQVERKISGQLQAYRGPWQIGGGLDVTVAYLRIGGTRQ